MHKKIQSWWFVILSIFLFTVTPEHVTAQEADEDFSLTIYHTGDIHANIDNFGKIAGFLNKERTEKENTLYFDSGDIFSGNPVVDLMDGIPMIELFNEMQLDLLTIGNHEFDYGQDIFQARRNESNFEWISANTRVVDSSIPIQQTKPYETFDFDGVTVGVIGLIENPPATAPSGIVGLEFDPYIVTAQQYSNLRDEVDILIGLNHIGIAEDRRLAEAVDFYDLILGGHSHSILTEPEIVNDTPIMHSGSKATGIGVLDISLNKETGEVSVDGKLQPVSELEEVDSTVQTMVDQYKSESDELLNVVIGKTHNRLERNARWERDVSLGNLITDSLRNFADTDIALTNNGGIREEIEAGENSARDIFSVDPFGNVVSIIEMSGHDLKEVIAYSFHRSLENYGPQIDLQTSGLNYIIYTKEDGTYADSELFIDGEPMDLDKRYTIATNNFIVDGGDGYDFSKATIIQEDQGQVTNALIQYIEEVTARDGAVDYAPTEGRIQTLPFSDREDEGELTDAEKYTPTLSVKELTFDLNEGEAVLPKAQTLISNIDELPEGTVVSYVNKSDIDLTGANTEAQTLELLVTYPDESTVSLEIKVSVIAFIEEGEDENGTNGEGTTPPEDTEEDTDKEDTVEDGNETKVENDSDELPKTGESNGSNITGLTILLAGSILLIIAKNKQTEEIN